MRKEIYNLEFPSHCPAMSIFGYRFTRVDDYQDRIASLQHLITYSSESEFEIYANTGKHAVTAYVDIPESEEEAALAWTGDSNTALIDILLLLSIFTGRDVFAVDNAIDDGSGKVITADSQVYQWGGTLGCSLPYRAQPIEPSPDSYNIGFEEGLNKVYELIRTEEWQRKYQKGYFLLLAQQAFRNRSLDMAFTLCWTIWEHLFAILNPEWLPESRARQIHSAEKVAFLLVKYELKDNIGEEDRKQIEGLVGIRNELVHSGRFPKKEKNAPKCGSKDYLEQELVYDDAILFIRLTEFIIAKTLGLLPSDVFDTKKRLEDFLTQSYDSRLAAREKHNNAVRALRRRWA